MPDMIEVPGVIASTPVKRHEVDDYEFSNANKEGHTTRRCTCGETFEFFGKYYEGMDATLLTLVQHVYQANRDYHAENN